MSPESSRHIPADDEEKRARLIAKYGVGSAPEAIDTIAAYWQGERPEDLTQCIGGLHTSSEDYQTYLKALAFAEGGTTDNPEARDAMYGAVSLLAHASYTSI